MRLTVPRPALVPTLILGVCTAASSARASAQERQHTRQTVTTRAAGQTPLYRDLGTLHRTVSTGNPTAQRYFDQGLRLTYAFNHEEAINSFREATRLDSACAMCWWGTAHALGPNINAPMDTAAVRPAWDAISKAKALANRATPVERALILAEADRYAADPAAPRPPLDSAYARAMSHVARAHPNDPDALVLYAESKMNLAPWNYWTDRGKAPRPGTLEIARSLERAIVIAPNHPGACHFYIHAVEPSTTPGRATACADRLAALMPGAGHLVHMPSHIYMRTGRYDLVARHNHDAVAEDERYIGARHPTGSYQYSYYPHNYHMMWAGLTMLGRGDEAIAAARKVAGVIPPPIVAQVPPLEAFVPTPWYALARFGRWDALLAEPAPPASLRFATGMWHYTRGLAWAATGKSAEARKAADSVRAIAAAIPAEQPAGINSARSIVNVAGAHLDGEILAASGDTAGAVRKFREAIRLEDALTYDEPPPWYLPFRERLGDLLVASGDAAAAEPLYRDDLTHYPENGWSLHGLALSLRAQGKAREAAAVQKRFTRAWQGADTGLAEKLQ